MRTLAIIFIFLFKLTFISETYSSDRNKIPVKEIKISKDTVINETIKTLIDSKSVQILEYKKLIDNEFPEIVDERCVYIDYRKKSEIKEYMSKFDSELQEKIEKGKLIQVDYAINGETVNNNFNNLIDTYVSIYKINNHNVLFQPDIPYRVIMTDTSMIFKALDGWYNNKYKTIEKRGDTFFIEIYNDKYYVDRFEIKIIDKEKNIQVWRTSIETSDGERTYYYRLNIPLKNAHDIPVLNIYNTAGLDDIYENFDDLNLEKLFNN